MATTKVTFVTGTAEVRRRDPNRDPYHLLQPDQHLITEPNTPAQVNYVDGKCTCCPYGYHIDLDFLNFCRDVESGSTLRNLKRIQRTKRKLRKSMELMLDEQEGIIAYPNSAPPDVVHATEAGRLMHMVNYERSATHKILSQIDSSVSTTIANIDGSRGQRNMSTDSDEPITPYTAPQRNRMPLDESSHMTPSFSTSGRTDSLSSLSSVSTVSSEAPYMYQASLLQQQQQQQQHYQHSLTTKTTTKVQENPVLEMGTAEMKHYSTTSSAQLADNGMDEPDMRPPVERRAPAPPPRASPDVNQMSLQTVREAMSVSLQRMRELEEQVKTIPILQVRISVLKEEKRLLNLQLKASKATNKPFTRSIGVGEGRVDVIERVEKTVSSIKQFELPKSFSPMATSPPVKSPVVRSPPPTLPKPVRTFSVGVGDHSVIEPYNLQPDLPTGYTIQEYETEMELHRRTVYEEERLGPRIPASLNLSFQQRSAQDSIDSRLSSLAQQQEANQPHFTINQIQRSKPKAMTRTIGTGDGNVFEGSGLHVHEKEFRTVIIGQKDNVAKRNVGIECRVPTRDVGVSFMCDEEKPATRTIGVNVNYDTSGIMTSFDFKGETELRTALRGVLQRNVRSVATNCNFKPETANAGTFTDVKSGVTVACGDESMRIDVDIRPFSVKKTIGSTAKPDTVNKCISTEKGWMVDSGTNTTSVDKYNRSVMTEQQKQAFASTNTEPVATRNGQNQTEVKMFVIMDQLKYAATNTEPKKTFSAGVATDIIPSYNAAVNTTEKVTDLFRDSQQMQTKTTEIITIPKKVLTFDKGVGDCRIDDSFTFSETTEITTPKTTHTLQEDILNRGTSQANAFLSQSTESRKTSRVDDGNQHFSSYEVSRRSSAPPVDRVSSSHTESEQRIEKVSSKKPEDSFSETVVEHYIITKDGKKLVSEEKTTMSAAGSNRSYKEFSGVGSDAVSSGGYGYGGSGDSDYSSSKSYGYSSGTGYNGGSSGSGSSNQGIGGSSNYSSSSSSYSTSGSSGYGGGSSGYGSGTTGYGNSSSNYESGSSTYGSGLSSYGERTSGYGIGDSGTTYISSSSSGEGNGGSRIEKSYSSVVTNPYRTVENLAEVSSMVDSDSVDGGSRMMSKTSSEGNLYKGQKTSRTDTVKSMDTIYDMRRTGSVEDFMPDDIRKYMSIDPSTSKDSGFGEDLLQKFTQETSTALSSQPSSRRSSDPNTGMKCVKMSKTTTTTKRTSKNGGNVSVQETKTVEGPDGSITTTVTEMNDDGEKIVRPGGDNISSQHAALLAGGTDSNIMSSSSVSSSYSSSGHLSGGDQGGSESNLMSQQTFSERGGFSSGGGGMSFSESTLSTVGDGADSTEVQTYGSLDRKTGKLKSIMKPKKSQKEQMGKKKGIRFAESVTGGTGSSSEEEEGTSDSDSTASFEEGSYDSQQGEVVYRCKDDEAIAQGVPGAQMFDQNIRETYELSEEVTKACGILSTYLMDSTTIQTKQLNASLNVIQQEWFQVSSHKLSSPHQVEDFLSSVNEISKRLLEYIVNMSDANGNTAIHYCISHCNFEIANLLMDSEICDINKQNKAGYTPIMLAGLATVQNMEQREIVRRIFSHGDINMRATVTQQTALMLAASHGRTEMVQLLVEEGADINMQDVDGSTALMCACEHGHLEIVSFLLAQPNIDAHIVDNENSTALEIAMEAGHKDVGVVLYKHLNFSKPSSPGYHKKRKSSSSPTPSTFAIR